MEIKIGDYFQGIMNGRIIQIINVSQQAVTFLSVDNNKIYTTGRKTFEHCYLEKSIVRLAK